MTDELVKAVIPHTNISISGINKDIYNYSFHTIDKYQYKLIFTFSQSITTNPLLTATLNQPLWFKADMNFNLVNDT